jgi:hypothetical protein
VARERDCGQRPTGRAIRPLIEHHTGMVADDGGYQWVGVLIKLWRPGHDAATHRARLRRDWGLHQAGLEQDAQLEGQHPHPGLAHLG